MVLGRCIGSTIGVLASRCALGLPIIKNHGGNGGYSVQDGRSDTTRCLGRREHWRLYGHDKKPCLYGCPFSGMCLLRSMINDYQMVMSKHTELLYMIASVCALRFCNEPSVDKSQDASHDGHPSELIWAVCIYLGILRAPVTPAELYITGSARICGNICPGRQRTSSPWLRARPAVMMPHAQMRYEVIQRTIIPA